MAKVKEVSSYSGSAWSAATPLGADATNIDMTSNPSDYDSSTEETSTEIINTNDVKIISSDTDLTAWGKFNRFRKRVSNAFGTLSGKTLATAYTTTSADSKIYSASVLNSYMTNVIGYSGTTAPSAGTVASQLSSLNSKISNQIIKTSWSATGGEAYSANAWSHKSAGIIPTSAIPSGKSISNNLLVLYAQSINNPSNDGWTKIIAQPRAKGQNTIAVAVYSNYAGNTNNFYFTALWL